MTAQADGCCSSQKFTHCPGLQAQLQDRLMEVSELEDEIAGVHSQLEGQLLQKLDEQVLQLPRM